MDIKLVAEHVKGGHLFLSDLPQNVRESVESAVKAITPKKSKKK